MSCFETADGYSFDWNEKPEWNDPALCSPIPCLKGQNCTYEGCCSFVHQGEEGTGRRLFKARSADEKDIVRLVHQDPLTGKISRPDYYSRRQARLSWPDWCKKMGLPLPQTPKAPKAPLVVPPLAEFSPFTGTSTLRPWIDYHPFAQNHRRPVILDLSEPQEPKEKPKEEEPMPISLDLASFPKLPQAEPVDPAPIPITPIFHEETLTNVLKDMRQIVGESLWLALQQQFIETKLIEALQEKEVDTNWLLCKITGMIMEANKDDLNEVCSLTANKPMLRETIVEACEMIFVA